MTACASLPMRLNPPTTPRITPSVWVDGQPEPRLQVTEITHSAPLDRVAIEMQSPADVDPATQQHWTHAPVHIAWPMRLSDGEIRWQMVA